MDRAGRPRQQRCAELTLQPLHQLAQSGLTDPELLGRTPEMQVGGYRHERLKLTELHPVDHTERRPTRTHNRARRGKSRMPPVTAPCRGPEVLDVVDLPDPVPGEG